MEFLAVLAVHAQRAMHVPLCLFPGKLLKEVPSSWFVAAGSLLPVQSQSMTFKWTLVT